MVKKVFIVCPRERTRAVRNQHQVCDYLVALGADAYMIYHPNPDGDRRVLYPELPNVRVADHVEDAPENLVIVPETNDLPSVREECPASRIAIWWRSYVNAALNATVTRNLRTEFEPIHLFHSVYEYAMIRPHLLWSTPWFFLTDYIDDDYLRTDTDSLVAGKADVVCFNGVKDKITGHICAKAGIECIPIAGLPPAEVGAIMRRCKVYVDNGFHSGNDHMPRQAAMSGCVVISNKSGSAAFAEIMPIEEKIVLDSDLYDLIPAVFNDFRYYYDKQRPYREQIRGEKRAFEAHVENFWRQVCGADA